MNILDIAIAKKLAGGGGGSGTDNYNDLSNLPKINDTTLSGNKSSSALGLQSEINSDSKLASDLVDDTNQDNKFVTSTEKSTWNGKQNAIDADHKINADYVDDSTSTNKFVTASDKETWNAKQNAIDNSHKLSSDLVDDANHTNKFVTSTEKQTWNAKQNAIDADHKLSSSLVSFSTAEAAALASGIDSSKVGQISTNQTNILSVEDMVCATEFSSSTAYAVGDMVTYEHKLYKFINAHQGAWSASDVQNYDLTYLEAEDRAALIEEIDSGAKNILNLQAPLEIKAVTATNLNKGSVKLDVNNAAWTAYNVDCDTIVGQKYKFVVYTESISNLPQFVTYIRKNNVDGGNISEYPTGISNAQLNTIGAHVFEFTATTAKTWFGFYPNNQSAAITGSVTLHVMLCPIEAWNISQNYVPYALPNYDLTYLQAEDRASLAEVVDSGAKNLLTKDSMSASDNWVAKFALANSLSAGTYVFIANATFTESAKTNCGFKLYTSTSSDTAIVNVPTTYSMGKVMCEFTLTQTASALSIWTHSSSATFTNCMICTKAAFGVSSAFVPYRYDPYTTSWQNVANGTLYARRNGRTVTINGYVDNVSFTAGSVTSLGTINNEIGKPVQQVRAICSIGLNAYTFGEPSYITIGTDGNVVVTPKTYSGTGAVFFSVSYTI